MGKDRERKRSKYSRSPERSRHSRAGKSSHSRRHDVDSRSRKEDKHYRSRRSRSPSSESYDQKRRDKHRSRARRHSRSPSPPSRSRYDNRDRDRGSRRKDNSDRKGQTQDRGFRFDSPPKEGEAERDIKQLLSQTQAMPMELQNDPNSVNILSSIQAMSMAQTAKIDRKLYIGNLPPGMTQQLLLNMLNNAMLSLDNLIEEPGNPVISCWIASDGHYAFVEFRNAAEANLGFRLQGMNINGTEVKIGRPKSYENTMSQLGINVGSGLGALSGAPNDPFEENLNIGNDNDFQESLPLGGKLGKSFSLTLPSRVIAICNLVSFEASKDLIDFKNLYSDIWDKCSEFGTVESIKVPRPTFIEDRVEKTREVDQLKARNEAEEEEKRAAADPKFIKKSERRKAKLKREQEEGNGTNKDVDSFDDIRNYDFPDGFGTAFVEFATVSEAIQARKGIQLMKYSEMLVEVKYWLESKFQSEDFKGLKLPQKVLAIHQAEQDLEEDEVELGPEHFID